MTEPVPSKEMVLAIDRVCRGVGNFAEREQVRKEIIRLREDLRRTESARVAILAENTHYKREAAEANAMLNSEWFARVTYKQQLRAAQARIDALMYEHCPDEMSEEQRDRWAENQRAAQPPGDG